MDDGAAERTFGGIVGRLDAFDGDERAARGPDLEQVVRGTDGASGCAGSLEWLVGSSSDCRDFPFPNSRIIVYPSCTYGDPLDLLERGVAD